MKGRQALTFAKVPSALTAVGIDGNLNGIRSATLSQNKLLALQEDYAKLLQKSPSASIVIFSRFSKSIDALSKFMTKAFGSKIKGYWLKPATAPKKRHQGKVAT